MTSIYDDVNIALTYISSDCPRNEWFGNLCAIHDALGQNGYQIALDWSKQSPKFNQKDFDAAWFSIKHGAITKATLFEKAYQNGMPRPDKSDFSTKKESDLSHSQDEPPTFDGPPLDVYDDDPYLLERTENDFSESLSPNPNQSIPSVQSVQNSTSDNATKQANILRYWNSLKPFSGHEYLEKKKLNGKLNGYEVNLRCGTSKSPLLCGNFFAYPLLDLASREIVGFNRISSSGKMLAKDSIKSRNAAIFGNLNQDTQVVCICEGFADSVEIHDATKYTTLVANDAGNVPSVAKRVRELYPQCKIVVCPDNDVAGHKSVWDTKKVLKSQNLAIAYPINKDFSDDVLAGYDIAPVILNAKLNTAPQSQDRSEKELLGSGSTIVGLELNERTGRIVAHSPNLARILEQDSEWQGALRKNVFTNEIEKIKKLPISEIGNWGDADDLLLKRWINEKYQVAFSVENIYEAVVMVTAGSKYHPVQNYLNSLVWDGVKRVELFFSQYLHSQENEYTRFTSQSLFVSAVARAFEPGCKVDTMVILEGKQGIGKSATIKALVPDEKWFLDSSIDMGTKDGYQILVGHWLNEFAELDSLSKAESTKAKSFLSSRTDTYRPPYASKPIRHPRGGIFIGTTNHDSYLKDETGNRRYLPVKCGDEQIDIDAITKTRDQLWAEVVVMYKAGVKWWWNANSSLAHAIQQEQESRQEVDIWFESIAAYCAGKDEVSIEQIALAGQSKGSASDGYASRGDAQGLQFTVDKLDQRVKNRIAKVLTMLGYLRVQKQVNNVRQWIYQLTSKPVVTNRNPDIYNDAIAKPVTKPIEAVKKYHAQFIGSVVERQVLEILDTQDCSVCDLAVITKTTPDEMVVICKSLNLHGHVIFDSDVITKNSIISKPF